MPSHFCPVRALFLFLLSFSRAQTEVYYAAFNTPDCQSDSCLASQTYVIDECAYMVNDVGLLEYGMATWVTEGQVVRLGFYGQDDTCSSATGEWDYTMEVCDPILMEMVSASYAACEIDDSISTATSIGQMFACMFSFCMLSTYLTVTTASCQLGRQKTAGTVVVKGECIDTRYDEKTEDCYVTAEYTIVDSGQAVRKEYKVPWSTFEPYDNGDAANYENPYEIPIMYMHELPMSSTVYRNQGINWGMQCFFFLFMAIWISVPNLALTGGYDWGPYVGWSVGFVLGLVFYFGCLRNCCGGNFGESSDNGCNTIGAQIVTSEDVYVRWDAKGGEPGKRVNPAQVNSNTNLLPKSTAPSTYA